MAKYIDAEKLKAEIERMRKINRKAFEADHIVSDLFHGRAQAINRLCEFITSLQQEQPEVDLKKETMRWWKEYLHLNPENQLWMDAHQSVVFARHFYELGLNAGKENKE